ncbi:hypothetical protein HGRIS_011766 [Hohenbuehelia grisea]|uniref:Uncharacterized protein n=1 Tax=Hohenbuehelia grisea TaxID=104357 RepID=A0ABR3JX40_9AGAR
MFKSYFPVFALALFAQAVAGIKNGELCVSIAGPLGKCDDGLTCCFLGPDRSVCQEKCPIPQGGTCSGIAGPIYGDCAAGLKCCPKPQTADWSTCEKKCYLNHGETCNGFAGPIYGDCMKSIL